jgi:hypothetical protein
MKLKNFMIVATLIAAVVLTTVPAGASDEPRAVGVPAEQGDLLPIRLTMVAQGLGEVVSGQARLEITITRLSTQEEADLLIGALREMGPGAVRDELQKLPEAGRARLSAELSYPIQFARLFRNEGGGYNIVLATDRDIEPWEAYYRTRSLDYDLVLAELRLNDDLTGEGVLASGVMLGYQADTDTVIIEDYDTRPVRLKQVRVR